MGVDKAFLPGAAAQLTVVVVLIAEQLILAIAWLMAAFLDIDIIFFFTGSVTFYAVLSASILVFGLLFAISVLRLHEIHGGGMIGILGAAFGCLAGGLGIAFLVLAFLGLPLYADFGSLTVFWPAIPLSILTGVAMLFVGAFFIGYQRIFPKGWYWRAAGIVYILVGLLEFFIFVSYELVIVPFLLGAVCFLGEKPGK